MRKIVFTAVALIMLSTTAVSAAPCRNDKGKFVKCTTSTKVTKAVRCKDARGKFAKCGTVGAKPA